MQEKTFKTYASADVQKKLKEENKVHLFDGAELGKSTSIFKLIHP